MNFRNTAVHVVLFASICVLLSCKKEEEEHDPYFDEIDGQITNKKPDTLIDNAKQRYFAESDEQFAGDMYDPRSNRDRASASIPMEEDGGVNYVWVTINGLRLRAVFDTGASDVSLSLTEALLLYKQGSLTIEDYVGQTNYRIANGDLVPGMVVLLKNVNIGGVELYDVRASILPEPEAPLLLGQSVFKRFRSYSIDNINKEIVLEY